MDGAPSAPVGEGDDVAVSGVLVEQEARTTPRSTQTTNTLLIPTLWSSRERELLSLPKPQVVQTVYGPNQLFYNKAPDESGGVCSSPERVLTLGDLSVTAVTLASWGRNAV